MPGTTQFNGAIYQPVSLTAGAGYGNLGGDGEQSGHYRDADLQSCIGESERRSLGAALPMPVRSLR